MNNEHIIILVVGASLGALQAIILFMMKGALSKIINICGDVVNIRALLATKVNDAESRQDHKKLEVTLGEYKDRIVILEFIVK